MCSPINFVLTVAQLPKNATIKRLFPYQTAQFTPATGIRRASFAKAKEFSSGRTDPSTLANGTMTRPTAKASLSTLMETSTKASGKMTRPMDLENTLTRMALFTKATGCWISSMVMAKNCGLMEPGMRENFPMVIKKEEVYLNLLMVLCMKENFVKMKFMELEIINGLMAKLITDSGLEIK